MNPLPEGQVYSISGSFHTWEDVGEKLVFYEPRHEEFISGDMNIRIDNAIETLIIQHEDDGSPRPAKVPRNFSRDMLGTSSACNQVSFRVTLRKIEGDVDALSIEVWPSGPKCDRGSAKYVLQELVGYFGDDVPASIREWV